MKLTTSDGVTVNIELEAVTGKPVAKDATTDAILSKGAGTSDTVTEIDRGCST